MKSQFRPKSTLSLLAIALVLIPSWALSQLSRPLIPFSAVPKREHRARLLNIATDYTLYRELPPAIIEGDQEQYDFLLEHLDLTTYIVRKLGLGKQVLRKTANTLQGHDGEGLSGQMSLVYHENTKRIYLARGRLISEFFFAVSGRAAIVAQQESQSDKRQSLRLAFYIKLDNKLLDVMTHLFSPLLSGAMAKRISKFLTATSIASRAIQKDPERILEILRKADGLDERLKERFSSLFLRKRGSLSSPNVPAAKTPAATDPLERVRK